MIVLGAHLKLWAPNFLVDAHEVSWTLTVMYGRPEESWTVTRLCGCPEVLWAFTKSLDGHINSWGLTRIYGCPKAPWSPTRALDDHGEFWASIHALGNHEAFGCPRSYWASTRKGRPFGHPRELWVTTEKRRNLLGIHKTFWRPWRTADYLWASIGKVGASCGRPGNFWAVTRFLGDHGEIWPPMLLMESHDCCGCPRKMWVVTRLCGRPKVGGCSPEAWSDHETSWTLMALSCNHMEARRVLWARMGAGEFQAYMGTHVKGQNESPQP